MNQTPFQDIANWFWNPDFWLPPNTTWSDLTVEGDIQYARFEDLTIPLIMAWAVLLLRYLVEKKLFR